jgi:hypothetical protein
MSGPQGDGRTGAGKPADKRIFEWRSRTTGDCVLRFAVMRTEGQGFPIPTLLLKEKPHVATVTT